MIFHFVRWREQSSYGMTTIRGSPDMRWSVESYPCDSRNRNSLQTASRKASGEIPNDREGLYKLWAVRVSRMQDVNQQSERGYYITLPCSCLTSMALSFSTVSHLHASLPITGRKVGQCVGPADSIYNLQCLLQDVAELRSSKTGCCSKSNNYMNRQTTNGQTTPVNKGQYMHVLVFQLSTGVHAKSVLYTPYSRPTCSPLYHPYTTRFSVSSACLSPATNGARSYPTLPPPSLPTA